MEVDPYAQLTWEQLVNLVRIRGLVDPGLLLTGDIPREQLIELLRNNDRLNQVSPPPSPRTPVQPPTAPRKPMPGAPGGVNRQPVPLPIAVNRPTLPVTGRQPVPLPVPVTGRQPVPVTTQPVPVTTRPVPVTTQPVPVTTRPVPVTTQPVPVTTQPVPVTTQPVPVTTQPRPIPTVPVTTGRPPVLPPNVGQKRPVPLPDLTQRVGGPPTTRPTLPVPTVPVTTGRPPVLPPNVGQKRPVPLPDLTQKVGGQPVPNVGRTRPVTYYPGVTSPPRSPPRSPQRIPPPVPETKRPDPMVVRAALMRKFGRRTDYPMYDMKINPSTPRNGYQLTADEKRDGREFVQAFKHQYVYHMKADYTAVAEPTIGYLMHKNDNKFTTDLISALGYDRLTDTLAGLYNFLWYLNLAGKDASTLDKWEKSYLSGLDEKQLLQMLGPQYKGPQDKASLLFAAVTGQSTHRPSTDNIPRYPEVMTYTPPRVWMLANGLYNIVQDFDGQKFFSPYAPYVHVALQPQSPIEQVIVTTTIGNVDERIRDYQIVLPTQNPPTTAQEKLDYFINEIKKYEYVFTRTPGTLPPPVLKDLTKNQVKETLKEYTLKEIVDAYEPIETWKNRERLIEIVYEEGQGGSIWSWRNKYCNNDDTDNIIDGERHGAIDKQNPEDPTLSYGVQKNYRCYQMYELEASFREDDNGIFHFAVPDWIHPSGTGGQPIMDPTTGAPLVREFSVQSMRQLSQLLQNPPEGYDVKPLRDKVMIGLEAANSSAVAARALRQRYEAMTPEEQNLVQVYLGWLFLFGMWMRFWKGPGYPYPVKWVEFGGGVERCGEIIRDEHVFIQLAIRTTLIEAHENNPTLNDFISNLPLVNYNFQTGEATLADPGTPGDPRPYRINDIIEPLQRGKFCEAHGSDLILKSSYYLITRILNLTTGAEFNNFLNLAIKAVSQMEKNTVEKQLAGIKNRTQAPTRVEALENRLRELNNPKTEQPPFDPTVTGRTGHRDPGLGWDIKFAQ